MMTRPPTTHERALITKLLSVPFLGREELQEQAATASVRVNDDPLDSSILLAVDRSSPRAHVLYRVPVDASAPDIDGVRIDFLLHVADGWISELEIYRVDGEPVQQMPTPASLNVVVYPIQG
jgi:hypothetical protein